MADANDLLRRVQPAPEATLPAEASEAATGVPEAWVSIRDARGTNLLVHLIQRLVQVQADKVRAQVTALQRQRASLLGVQESRE